MSGPIAPSQAADAKAMYIPEAVFDAFNREIATHLVGKRATVSQARIVAILVNGGMERREIFDNGYLNVEDAYRAKGWKVGYGKSSFNESGDSFFYFEVAGG